MASLYYLPLFHMFGFNPRPYTVVRLALLLLDSLDEQTGRLGSSPCDCRDIFRSQSRRLQGLLPG